VRPAAASALQNPRRRSHAVKIAGSSTIAPMRLWPCASRCSTAARVAEQDDVGLELARRPVDEDEVHAEPQLRVQVAVVGPGRDD
jgi:hypothetical protein